jgi:hypothetical protein
MRGFIAHLTDSIRSRLPRTYIKVVHLVSGLSFFCTPADAAEAMLSESEGGRPCRQLSPNCWTVGDYEFTFVRMTPRRFAALTTTAAKRQARRA